MVWTTRPCLVLGRIDLPQLLDADAVGLRIDAFAQIEALLQALGERAPATLGEDGLPGVQFHARRVAVGVLAVLADAHVAGGDALDRAVLVVQHLGRGEARIDLDAQLLGLGRQPAAEHPEADDVVAVIVHLRRVGQLVGLRLRQVDEVVFGRRRIERRALFLPVRNQLVQGARFQHGARKQMRAHFRALFQDADGNLALLLGCQLFQPDRRTQARWPGADDHDIVFHYFASHGGVPTLSLSPSSGGRKKTIGGRRRAVTLPSVSISSGTTLNRSPTRP